MELNPSSSVIEADPPMLDFEDLQMQTGLTSHEFLPVEKVLRNFLPLFSRGPGLCKDYVHKIQTATAKPIKSHPRPMTPAKRKILEELFKSLLDKDSIEEANGPWAFNPVIVPKPNGKWRLCVDYRNLNAVTESDSYGMMRIDDVLTCLGSAKCISTFDIPDGFHNISIFKPDRCKTAFNTPWGLWQYKRMPFGLKNSPASFQRVMDEVLGQYKWKFVLAFVDDLIVFLDTLEEHIGHLELIFQRLQDRGLKVHPDKMQLLQSKIHYLGFIIENGKVSPNPEKLKALEGYQIPRNVKDIMRFLGFCGYYRQFIPTFSEIAKPLTNMLGKGIIFFWSSEAQKAFELLRCELLKASSLCLPDLNKPFVIQTDASDIGIGAVLLQEHDEKKFPIYFYSRTLNQAEKNYTVSEKECLAVVQAIKKFRGFIECSHFTVETDHQALCWLKNVKEPVGRLARWALELQGYDFNVVYRAGKLNRTADALSRAAPVLLIESATELSRTKIVEEQNADIHLKHLIGFIKSGELPEISFEGKEAIVKLCRDAIVTDEGCLLKRIGPRDKPWEDEESRLKLWLPKSLILQVIDYFHSDLLSAHLGIRKTYLKIEDRFWWKSMRKDIIKFISSCDRCQRSKTPRTAPVGFGKAPVVNAAWETIALDLMGPYTKGHNQSQYLLVIVDVFTKWIELFIIRKAKTVTVCKKLWELCCRWGFPKNIISDNGSQFTSKKYVDWCKQFGISSVRIAPYHPQANITERYNQTVKTMIISTIHTCKDWDKFTSEISFALRSAVNDSTGFSPAYLNLGRELRMPIDNLCQIENSACKSEENFSQRMLQIQELAKTTIIESQKKYMKYYNEKRKESHFKVGDLVLLKIHKLSDASKGFTAALSLKYEGPFIIESKVTDSIYQLACPVSMSILGRYHISQIKSYLSSTFINSYGSTKSDHVDERQLSYSGSVQGYVETPGLQQKDGPVDVLEIERFVGALPVNSESHRIESTRSCSSSPSSLENVQGEICRQLGEGEETQGGVSGKRRRSEEREAAHLVGISTVPGIRRGTETLEGSTSFNCKEVDYSSYTSYPDTPTAEQ